MNTAQLSLENEAAEVGLSRGYDHASYVTAYGGTLNLPESLIPIPPHYDTVYTYYTAAFLQGIDEYVNEQMDNDCPDWSVDA